MAHFVEKNSFCEYLSLFTDLYKNSCLQLSQIFHCICPFSNYLRKKNFLSISELLFERDIFLLKREVFSKFPRKRFKTTGKHSLAVCASFCGEKLFLLIFVPFYWFDQKQLFKQIQIFLWICPFSNLLRTTNFLSISVELSERVTFWTKKRSSL